MLTLCFVVNVRRPFISVAASSFCSVIAGVGGGGGLWLGPPGMAPDVERIITSIGLGDQDTVQLLLDSYNTQVMVAMTTASERH